MTKPSLQEIADMPMPASIEAMRKHYNPRWNLPHADDASFRLFRVKLTGEVTTKELLSETVEIAAYSSDEAIELAEKHAWSINPEADEIEFDMREAEDIGEAPADWELHN